jgi:hypothetical protein
VFERRFIGNVQAEPNGASSTAGTSSTATGCDPNSIESKNWGQHSLVLGFQKLLRHQNAAKSYQDAKTLPIATKIPNDVPGPFFSLVRVLKKKRIFFLSS